MAAPLNPVRKGDVFVIRRVTNWTGSLLSPRRAGWYESFHVVECASSDKDGNVKSYLPNRGAPMPCKLGAREEAFHLADDRAAQARVLFNAAAAGLSFDTKGELRDALNATRQEA